MLFFIYSRKSVYTGKGESVENQIEMCRQYITSKFPEAEAENIVVYEDEGFSAKNTDRPQFQQMLRDIRIKKPNYIVCYRLDRISRNVSDFSTLIEDLNGRSISFICIKEEFDTSKPMGKAMMYIASVFAQLERETIAERVRDNMLMLARTGRWLGGTTPTGYTSERVQEIILDGKMKTACTLKDNPEELPAVDAIFEKFLELHSISGVSKYLIKRGFKSRSGKHYSLLGIKDILQNPVYCIADKDALQYFMELHADVCFEKKDCSSKYGLIAYNKRDYKKSQTPRQPVEKWIIAVGRHKGRVTGKKWAAVQTILKENIPTGKKPAKIHNDYSLLSGLIYCEKCGSRMFAKPRPDKNGQSKRFDYVCNSKLKGGRSLCSCQNINGQQADDMVYKTLKQYADEGCCLIKRLEKLKNSFQGQKEKEPVAAVEAKIQQRTEKMRRLIDALSQENHGGAFLQRVDARISELDNELSELSREREQLLKSAASLGDTSLQTDLLADAMSNLKDYYEYLSIPEKRTLVRLMTDKIIWDGESLLVVMNR